MLLVYSLNSAQNIGIGSLQTLELLLLSVIVLAAFLLIEYRSKAPLMPLGFLRRSSIFGANAVGLLQVATICRNGIYSDELSSAGARLLCAFGWPCIHPYGYCISSRFCIFVSTIGKSLRCQTNHNFRNGFADNWLSIPFTDLSHRKLLWRIARTNAPHRGWNWIKLHCNQHSRTHRN